MTDSPLVTQNTVRKSRVLRANRKLSKKDERPKRLFDSSTKIYRLVRLSSEEVLDLCGGMDSQDAIPPELPSNTDQILANIQAAQVVGMSGSGFPAAQKIETALASDASEKYLVINGIESDPALIHDEWLLRNRWDAVLAGIRALQACMRFTRIVVASRIDYPTQGAEELGVEIQRVNSFYPLGEEHFLINKTLGIKLEQNQIPAEQGILEFNVQTVAMIGHAASTGEALPYRYLTAANLLDGTAQVVRAPLGEKAEKILLVAFGRPSDALGFVGDGALAAHPVTHRSKIEVTTSAVLYAQPISFMNTAACTGCGTCTKRCPLHLPVPGMVQLEKYGRMIPEDVSSACFDCKACTYFCKVGIDAAACVKQPARDPS